MDSASPRNGTRYTNRDSGATYLHGADGNYFKFLLAVTSSDDQTKYLIANLGLSMNFAQVDLTKLTFPTTMSIDWIRVYQPKDAVNIGCDPVNFPTSQYIETYGSYLFYSYAYVSQRHHHLIRYKNVYTNPNITTWDAASQPWPKNRLLNGGC